MGQRHAGAARLRRAGPDHGADALRHRTVAARGKREADNALAAFVASVGNGAVRPSAAVTFGELVECWLDTARPEWSPSNDATVLLIVRTDLGPLLTVRIDRLRPADLDAFYAGVREWRAGLCPLSVASVRRIQRRPIRARAGRPVGGVAGQPGGQGVTGAGVATVLRPPHAEAVVVLLERAEQESRAFAVFLVLSA